MATNIVDATPKGNIPSMAMIEPASDHPHFLLCRVNTPPTIGNIAEIIDNTKRMISMVLTRGATKGKSLAGTVPWRNITRLTEVIAMISPIAQKTLIAPVIIFKMPAVVGFQVFIFKTPDF
jgi:hypothetical protein